MRSYTMCGHPTWSDGACQLCDSCRDGRARLRQIEASSQNVIAVWENEASKLEAALDELRAALGNLVVMNEPREPR